VSQITPTQTTCSQFSTGTAPTLSNVFYSTKGTTISTDNPGVFFYWVTVKVESSGTVTKTITQGTTYAPKLGKPYFVLGAGSFAYSESCATGSALSTMIEGPPQALKVKFHAASPGTYFIGIKYQTKSIVGSGPAAGSYNYTFETTGIGGSTSGLTLKHS
jgi:hypothetical protein